MGYRLESERSADGVVYWHLWDEDGRTVDAAFDHLLDLVDRKGSRPSTVEGRAYALKKWYSFLQIKKTIDIDATDDTLSKFRKHLMSRSTPNRSDSEQAHKRTVNQDLRGVYKFASFEFGVGGFGGSRAGVSPAQRTLEARSPSKMSHG